MKPTITPEPSPNRLLEKRTAQGRHVRPSKGPGYAPAEFAADPEATGVTPKALAASMHRLYDTGKIVTKESGPPIRRRLTLRPKPISPDDQRLATITAPMLKTA